MSVQKNLLLRREGESVRAQALFVSAVLHTRTLWLTSPLAVDSSQVNVLIWDKHASITGIGALCVCLLGGSLYQQAPLRDGGSEYKKVPQDEASSALSPLETKCSEDADAV